MHTCDHTLRTKELLYLAEETANKTIVLFIIFLFKNDCFNKSTACFLKLFADLEQRFIFILKGAKRRAVTISS